MKGEGDMRPSGDGEPMGSLLIYPGCKVIIVAMIIRMKMVMLTKLSLSQIYLFEEPNFEGEFVEYTGPAVMPDPKYLFGVSSCLYLWTLATENICNFPLIHKHDFWLKFCVSAVVATKQNTVIKLC